MRIRPLGPEGIQQRIREIRAKIDSISSSATAQGTPTGFVSAVPLGPIGSGNAGLAPLSPFAEGVSVQSQVAPPEILKLLHSAADDAGVDRDLYESLIAIESSFNPHAVSPAGAKGLAQLMPGTAAALGVSDPFDPEQSLRGGARYLAQLLAQFGDAKLAVAAYNAGPGRVERYGGIPPIRETQDYVQKVFNRLEGRRP